MSSEYVGHPIEERETRCGCTEGQGKGIRGVLLVCPYKVDGVTVGWVKSHIFKDETDRSSSCCH